MGRRAAALHRRAPLIVRETRTENGTPVNVALDRLLRAYVDSLSFDRKVVLSRYRIIDVARKVVGVGSVGTACWMIMLHGASEDDPLFLQHAKSGDAAMIAGYCGKSDALDEAIGAFAIAYMGQTERDHAALIKAKRTGRVKATAG